MFFKTLTINEIMNEMLDLFSILSYENGEAAWQNLEAFRASYIQRAIHITYRELGTETHTEAERQFKALFIAEFDKRHAEQIAKRDATYLLVNPAEIVARNN